MKRLLTYALLVLTLLSAISCRSRRGVIPKEDMARIYAGMFLADQQLELDRKMARVADTSRVYEAIFAKYGYDVNDFRTSQRYYLLDGRRYVKVLKKAQEILEDERAALSGDKSVEEALKDYIALYNRMSPKHIFVFDTLHMTFESMYAFDFQEGMDTVYDGPAMIVAADSVVVADTLENAEI